GFNSFGFYPPGKEAKERIDGLMFQYLSAEKAADYIINGIKTGWTYKLAGNRIINLVLVRLTDDTDIKIKSERINHDYSEPGFYEQFQADLQNNKSGDRVQLILEMAVKFCHPNAIISFGANAYLPSDIYEIETLFLGLDPAHCHNISPF